MPASRFYSSVAPLMHLTAGVNSSVTTFAVDTVAGLPANTPFTICVNKDQVDQELCDVTAISGLNLTVVRGVDGTTALDHSLGAEVTHDSSARDHRESREHEATNTGVHGTGGRVVGDTDTMALTNKTIDGHSNSFLNVPASELDGLVEAGNMPVDAVYLTGTQTLTNKTISGTTNTLTNLPGANIVGAASIGKSVVPADTVFLADTQTLTNKTISGAANTLTNLSAAALVGANNTPKGVLPTDTVYSSADVALAANLSVVGTVTAPHIPKEIVAFRVTATGAGILSGNTLTQAIVWSTFTSKTFAHAPIVVIGMATQPGGTDGITARVSGVTTTGCNIIVDNPSSSTSSTVGVEYDLILVEATAAAAAG